MDAGRELVDPLPYPADANARRPLISPGRMLMPYRHAIGAAALTAALLIAAPGAQAFDDAKYPNLKGQWNRIGSPRWDQQDRYGERAPLIPEYQAIHAANLADQRAGGQGTDPTYTCLAPGMPRAMVAYEAMEVVVTPDTTYILIDHIHDSRRIFTDGRDWSAQGEPTFAGFSLGTWIDEDGDGRYDVLAVETRNFKGPRTFDESGLPLHRDNQTIVKERIYLDKTDPGVLHDEITVIDHALTRPWTVTKNYRREPDRYPAWREVVCTESNQHVRVGKDDYFLSADGHLMPARKDQAPPDLRYFDQSRK
jgi:hypothetical protein